MAEVIWNKQAEEEWRKKMLYGLGETWRVPTPSELPMCGIAGESLIS
jgi:hypothetical protein